MTYTHRNGETEAPTVPGKYWLKGSCLSYAIADLIPVIAEDDHLCAWRPYWGEGWFERMEHFTGQWWGPIVAPWESSK